MTLLMPSVKMRRTTRVFGARILRSGRRLYPTQEVSKHMRRPSLAVADAEEDWIELLDVKQNGWRNSCKKHKGIDDVMEIDDGKSHKEINLGELWEIDSVNHVNDDGNCAKDNKRWGLVYSRKRKRNSSSNDYDNSDKKFGKKFVRHQSKKKTINEESPSVLPPNNTTNPISPQKISKSKKKKAMNVQFRKSTRLNSQNLPPRNSVNIHRVIQKRRTSLRSRKQRNPSSSLYLKSSNKIVKDGVSISPIKSNPEISRSTIQRASFKELKELTQDIDSVSCNASILVIESDRCYRETGAVITMEMSGPKQWFLVVRTNGLERFWVETRNFMRPCFINRVTHAIIWAGGDDSWKLEFSDRQDWFIFKELYRKCSDRTVRLKASLTSIIPVPRVNEVSGYADGKYLPFKMPDSYICTRGDEVSRMLERSEPVYDMDSDDDEWLNRFNDENKDDLRVGYDTFEKIIDAFEKGIYGSPEDYSDVKLAVDRCLMIASKDVLEAVYGYWMNKRKKKQSALVQVFQFYKPIKPEQLNFKGVLRKKRSFRQRGNQSGRGKQLTFLKALYEKKTVAESETATIKVQEIEAAALAAEQAAVTNRQKAQVLMEVADLLTYKAAIALKIAEARSTSKSVDELFFPLK